MSLLWKAFAFVLIAQIASAVAIPPAQAANTPDINLSSPQALGPELTAFLRTSHLNATLNSSSVAVERRTECNAAISGAPKISSCLDVYKQMTDSDKEAEFGDRTRGVFDYPLPYRWSSSDGECVIDIENLPWGSYKDTATMSEMRDATLDLINECVFNKHAGGITLGLGSKGSLAVTVGIYKPDVECQSSVPKYPNTRECGDLLSIMPASPDEQIFGEKGGWGVEVGLPFDIPGPKRECGFYFTSSGGEQRRSWRDLWEAATAIQGICGRNREPGTAFVGDEKKFISVAMYRPSGNPAMDHSTIESLLKNHDGAATA